MPEVGLELHSRPCKHGEPAEKMRNPSQFEGCLAQYETKSMDIVHTPFSGALEDYRGTRCLEISAAAFGKSIVPAATPTTRSKPSSVVKSCR